MRAPSPPALAAGLLALWLAGLAMPARAAPALEEPQGDHSELWARRLLIDARLLRNEGRLESAARVAARGLEFEPGNASLHRLLAEVLETLGRSDEAQGHRARADEIDPPPLPPPASPLVPDAEGVLVVLLPPPDDPRLAGRLPSDWPGGVVSDRLAERLGVRLPGAEIHLLGPADRAAGESVPAARAWLEARGPRAVLSLRVERALCGESTKDGPFAMVWLRVAASRASAPAVETAAAVREVISPPPPDDCLGAAAAWALERALQTGSVQRALVPGSTSGDHPWSAQAIRSVFPELDLRIAAEIEEGRRLLALGELGAAAARFESAAQIDPGDIDARAFLVEVERSLALSRQIETAAGSSTTESSESLASQLTPDQRAALERNLKDEQQRRHELVAVLALLDEGRSDPAPPPALSSLRPTDIRDPDETGPRLAQERSTGSVEARVLYTPDGGVAARYFFAPDPPTLLLRESDRQGDGRPDRWIAYADGERVEIWEDRQASGVPDVHLVYRKGGGPLARVEIDTSGDGRFDRVFRYTEGRIRTEARDTTGNGHLDLFDHFDADGELELREEDIDGSGEIDLRTAYRSGRVLRREIVNPEAVTQIH